MEGIIDRRFENADQRLGIDLRFAELHGAHRGLLFPLDEVALFTVDENAAAEVAFVGIAVELERVRKEVIDVDYAAVGVVPVRLHVGILPDDVVRLELEDVGVHLEDQQVVGHLYLGFELAPVAVFEPHAPVEESVQLVVHFGSHLQQGFFQVVECGERVVENLLFERRFAHDGFEDFLSQGYAFHAISKD